MSLALSIAMIPTGLALSGWGFWASGKRGTWRAVVGQIAAPLGMFVALMGTLLVCVPDFFSG
jgi:hypothetical protein